MFETEMFDDESDIEVEQSGIVVTRYLCNSCGSIFGTSNYKIDTCPLCGEHSLSTEDYVESKEYSIVPFVKEIRDAQATYFRKTFWNPLIPFTFKVKRRRKDIQKVYLPAFLLNANQSGRVLFLGGEKKKIVKDRKKCLEIKKYDVYHTINVDYNHVLTNVSTKIDDRIFNNICQYDMDHLKPFQVDSLQDSSYLSADIEASEVGNKEREKIARNTLFLVRDNVPHALKKLKEDQSTISFHGAKEVLVPAYLVAVPYRKNKYLFIMNGENGASYMELPVGILPTILLSIFVFGIVILIAYLIACYL